jgi:hypothetical protein
MHSLPAGTPSRAGDHRCADDICVSLIIPKSFGNMQSSPWVWIGHWACVKT